MKKYISLVLVIVILCMTAGTYAKFMDVPGDAPYADAVEKMAGLGIMSGVSADNFNPEGMFTREQLARAVVVAAGLEDTASTLQGTSIFSDVEPGRWSSGYINAALNRGYIAGMTDGKFHPTESVTFAQACTALVKALGYTDQDIPGLWPRNYIEKAKSLGLTTGINLQGSDALPRWAAAMMLSRLLDTNMKKNSPTDTDKTFANATGLYTECVVLGNSRTSEKLAANQVLTDKGIYYVQDASASLELGNSYRFKIDGDSIIKVFDKTKILLNISVESAVGTSITYKSGNKEKSMTLPDKTIYYYQGVKQNYDSLGGLLQKNTSIVFALNDNNVGYAYGLIVDPVYSKPEIARNFDPTAKKLGAIDFSSGLPIIKDGEPVSISAIEDKDVVYQLTDIWNKNPYILVVGKRVEGTITGILPNKLSPKTLQIGNTNYELGKYMNFNKVNNSQGSYKVDDSVTALLGYDGKVVDILFSQSEDTSDYAFVLNSSGILSTDMKDYGQTVYTVKLFLTDGSTATYRVTNPDPGSYKGKLVRFNKVDDSTVTLVGLTYAAAKESFVKKDDKMIDSSYIADNIKIFNLLSNNSGSDAQVELLKWTNLPYGTIEAGKILYVNRAGPFEDINVLLLNDIQGKQFKAGIVKSSSIRASRNTVTYSYTITIDGKDYGYNSQIANAMENSVVGVAFSGNTISYSTGVQDLAAENTKVQAYDTKRIKMNDKIYLLKDNMSVYFRDPDGTLTLKGIKDIDTNETYGRIAVYLDKPLDQGGKVDLILVSTLPE